MKIVSRETWGARHADGAGPAPLPAKEVWLHHSVTPAPKDDPAAERQAMRLLERIGQERFGRGISYTFAVMPSGRVYQGHSIDRRGAHTKGRNGIARAIVLVGDYSSKQPPAAMVQAVADLIAHGHDKGWWKTRALAGGHRDAVTTTACPGDAAYKAIRWINAAVSRPPTSTPPTPEEDMPVIARVKGEPTQYLTDLLHAKRSLDNADEVAALKVAGIRDVGEVPAQLLADVPTLKG